MMAHHLLFAKQASASKQQMVELQEARSNYLESIQEGVTFLREHGLVESARHAADMMLGRCGLYLCSFCTVSSAQLTQGVS